MIQPTKQILVDLIDKLPDSEIPVAHRFIEFLIQQNEDRFLDDFEKQEAEQILAQSSEKDWIPWEKAETELDELHD